AASAADIYELGKTDSYHVEPAKCVPVWLLPSTRKTTGASSFPPTSQARPAWSQALPWTSREIFPAAPAPERDLDCRKRRVQRRTTRAPTSPARNPCLNYRSNIANDHTSRKASA